MSNIFKMIKTNIDVSKPLKIVLDNPQDWTEVRKVKNVHGNYNGSDFLPLMMGTVKDRNTSIYDSNYTHKTHLYDKYSSMIDVIKELGFTSHHRCAFFKLEPGHSIEWHQEIGKYYEDKDRWHLSLQGTYLYRVGKEEYIIEPGTFFWFDNKQFHEAINIGDNDRISFVWDSNKGMTDWIKDIKEPDYVIDINEVKNFFR